MARMAIKAGKSGPKSVPTPGTAPSMVLGSRPATFRAPPVPRIKPLLGQRQYGKPEKSDGPLEFSGG